MALENHNPDTLSVLKEALSPVARYRCIVFQAGELARIQVLSEAMADGISFLGKAPVRLAAVDFLDDVGALACGDVLARIDSLAKESPVVLIGPLHFLDYWSHAIQAGFWAHLASFTKGPGIVVLDALRTRGIDGRFAVYHSLPKFRVRVLKSRLCVTEASAS